MSLEERLDEITKKIERLEQLVTKGSYAIGGIQDELALLHTVLSASTAVTKTLSDFKTLTLATAHGDMGRHIVQSLIQYGPMNISRLTHIIRNSRGSASRRIVAKKLQKLREKEVVEVVEGKRSEKIYKIRDDADSNVA